MIFKRLICHTLRALTLASFLLVTLPSQAAMYGYVDDTGRVHVSSQKIDERYQYIPPGQTLSATRPVNRITHPYNIKPARPVTPSPARVERYRDMVEEVAARYKLNPDLLHAIISVESGYNPKALSNRGAHGLMQVTRSTARRFGSEQPMDPRQNLEAGARYISYLLKMFDNRLTLVIAAYNAGEGAVKRYNAVPPYAETRQYVAKVLATYAAASMDDNGAAAPAPRLEKAAFNG
ncbi:MULTISPECIES: lytic transglycosylase domain-containing protein [Microvirgula]|uniref:Lytic transglycosylase domain-containing protein n=1 Tax=Microvirgula aerodenitrificans TaxID=57480 RepID=A0A2S0P6I4_9NEIS|nr:MULTISPECIES: lytic transglycosylase domain-containing protein [Microvirgula]AVY92988.1 lytic transglycosylase domain-containing protein [Microvirgula aerodenitrificans]RAS12875.1 uncharacterized protein DUF4124 [Microvirgula sp. AG722]